VSGDYASRVEAWRRRVEESKHRLKTAEEMKHRFLMHHGYEATDHPIYAMILRLIEDARRGVLEPEPEEDREYSTEW